MNSTGKYDEQQQQTLIQSENALLRENLLIFPVCVIRNICIRKLSHFKSFHFNKSKNA